MAEVLTIGRAPTPSVDAKRSAVRWLSYAFFAMALLFAAVAAALGDVFFAREDLCLRRARDGEVADVVEGGLGLARRLWS